MRIDYELPRDGIFNVDTNVYDVQVGWVHQQVQYRILAEDDLLYFHGKNEHGIELGIHKSRLVQWLPTQLELYS